MLDTVELAICDEATEADRNWNADRNAIFLRLVMADNPAEITRREKNAGIKQSEAVDYFIEIQPWWSEVVPGFVGGKGTQEERLAALRAAYLAER